MKALWHISSEYSEIRELKPFDPQGGAVANGLYSFISPGTERLVASGLVSREWTQMQVPGMQGHFGLPCTYGYSWVGILATSQGEQLIHALHPHQTHIQPGNTIPFISIPNHIPPIRATLKSNLETIFNALIDGVFWENKKIAIVGAGNIGLLLAMVLKFRFDRDAIIFDTDENRLEQAKAAGIALETETGPFDLVYHTSSSESGLQNAIEMTSNGGKVIELSWYGSRTVTLHLGGSFHYGRKSICASQVAVPSEIPFSQRLRFGLSDETGSTLFEVRNQVVLDWLSDPRFDYAIQRQIPFSETPAFFNDLRKGKVVESGVVICY